MPLTAPLALELPPRDPEVVPTRGLLPALLMSWSEPLFTPAAVLVDVEAEVSSAEELETRPAVPEALPDKEDPPEEVVGVV